MKKIIFMLTFTILLTLGACGLSEINTGDEQVSGESVMQTSSASEVLPEVSSTPIQTQAQMSPEVSTISQDISQYIFYRDFHNVPKGIFRYNLDGVGELFWLEGDIGLIGHIEDWIYCIDYDNDYEIFKIDVTGQQRQNVQKLPWNQLIIVDGSFYYLDNQIIYRTKPGEEVEAIAQIPNYIDDAIMNLHYNNGMIFYSIKGSWPELWCLYVCDLKTGETKEIKKDIDESYAIDDNYIYYIGNVMWNGEETQKYDDGDIYRFNLNTWEEEFLFETGFSAYDINIFNDWLIYMTSPKGINASYINGFNLITQETFALKSPGNSIYEVLPMQINIEIFNEGLKGRLIIEDGEALVEVFD